MAYDDMETGLTVVVVSGAVITIIQNDVVASAALSGGVVAGGKIEYDVGIEQLLVDGRYERKSCFFFYDAGKQYVQYALEERCANRFVPGRATKYSLPHFTKLLRWRGRQSWMTFSKLRAHVASDHAGEHGIHDCRSFTDANNKAMNQVMVAVTELDFGSGAAMAWAYFVLISICIAAVGLIFLRLNKKYF